MPEIITHIFNQQGGVKDFVRNRGRGHIANVTDGYKGGREGQIFAHNSVT